MTQKNQTSSKSVEGNSIPTAEEVEHVKAFRAGIDALAEKAELLMNDPAASPELKGELRHAAKLNRRAGAALDAAAAQEGGLVQGLKRVGTGFVARIKGFAMRIWNLLKALVGMVVGTIMGICLALYEAGKFLLKTLWGLVSPSGFENVPLHAGV